VSYVVTVTGIFRGLSAVVVIYRNTSFDTFLYLIVIIPATH